MNSFSDMSVGISVEREYEFTPARLVDFADLVDDHAPVHMDAVFARSRGYSDRIVHGFFVGAIFSALLGNGAPGVQSVINQISMKMHKPVMLGDRILYRVVVSQVSPATQAVVLNLSASSSRGVTVMSGTAICSFPRGVDVDGEGID